MNSRKGEKEEKGKGEKQKRRKKNKGKKKRVKREACLVGLEPPEPLPKWRP